ncbi:MAG: glutathione binding-like protein, partial [Pseudomonadota bacterium]
PIAKGIAGKVREGYLTPNLTNNLAFMEQTLAQSTWFTGDTLTAADVQMSFIAEGLSVNLDLDRDFPNIARFRDACRASAGYQRALERGGPFELALNRK